MFTVNEDCSIYVTRGDAVVFGVTMTDENGESKNFLPGDLVRIKIYEKKNVANVVLQKDFPVTSEMEAVEIYLSGEETKLGEIISKPKEYWYEIELNPLSEPQTIVGYGEDGAIILKLFPEGGEK